MSCPIAGDCFSDRCLERCIYEKKPKLTFEEWWKEYNKQHGIPPAYKAAEHAWKAAQENK